VYLAFPCGECGAELEVPEDAGSFFRCPHCLRNVRVPDDARRVIPVARPVSTDHDEADPGPVEIRGRRLVCPVCGGDRFWARRTLLNTALATLLEVEYLNRTARNQICADCGYIFWFFED